MKGEKKGREGKEREGRRNGKGALRTPYIRGDRRPMRPSKGLSL